jgi:SAM-dependent methyltransferase
VDNVDRKTVEGFGDEWSRYRQNSASLDDAEAERLFNSYFAIVPHDVLTSEVSAADIGCGSGRWAKFVAPRVKRLVLVDPSPAALDVARENLRRESNCEFRCESVGSMGLDPCSFDFVYSLGVLHHVPDTQAAVQSCVDLLRPGGRFLVYLYYRFDNRPGWFRLIWSASDKVRRLIIRMPTSSRRFITEPIALLVYWPLSRLAKVLDRLGFKSGALPLSFYKDKSLYVMRTDARDRFGTRLEQRFTRNEIEAMLSKAGLIDVRFREDTPFWCAIGTKQMM